MDGWMPGTIEDGWADRPRPLTNRKSPAIFVEKVRRQVCKRAFRTKLLPQFTRQSERFARDFLKN